MRNICGDDDSIFSEVDNNQVKYIESASSKYLRKLVSVKKTHRPQLKPVKDRGNSDYLKVLNRTCLGSFPCFLGFEKHSDDTF